MFSERSDSSSDRCVARLCAAGIAGGAQLPLTGARRFAAADSEQQIRHYRFGATDLALQTWLRTSANETSMQRSPGGTWPPGSLGGKAQRGRRTATRLTLYREGKGLLLAGRRIFQTPKPSPIAAQRERQTYRARASAAFMTEAAALPRGRWQPVGSFATRLSTAASRQLRLEGSCSPPFRVLRHWPTRIFLKRPSHRNRCCRQRASRVFHPAPWMQHPSPVEIVTAASGLIIGSINRESRIVAEQKGADGAVADEEYVARSISG